MTNYPRSDLPLNITLSTCACPGACGASDVPLWSLFLSLRAAFRWLAPEPTRRYDFSQSGAAVNKWFLLNVRWRENSHMLLIWCKKLFFLFLDLVKCCVARLLGMRHNCHCKQWPTVSVLWWNISAWWRPGSLMWGFHWFSQWTPVSFSFSEKLFVSWIQFSDQGVLQTWWMRESCCGHFWL